MLANNLRSISKIISTSNAFDISTLSYVGALTTNSISGLSYVDLFQDIYVSPDGTRLYLINRDSTETIFQFSFSTPFDLTTLSYVRQATTNIGPNSTGMTFSNDGTKIAICGSGSDTTSYATLSTAWDISTMTSFTTAQPSFNTGNLGSIRFINNGLYFTRGSTGGTNYGIFQLASAYNLASAPSVSNIATIPETGARLMTSNDGIKIIGTIGSARTTMREFTNSTAYDPTTRTEVDARNLSLDRSNISAITFFVTSNASGSNFNKHLYVLVDNLGTNQSEIMHYTST